MFKLVISDDEGKTTVVPLVRDEITIGRKEGNTIRLTERNVSRRHAKLRKSNGAFHVEDLRSYNGVKVNGRRINANAALKAGDQISIGDYLLALQLDAVDVAGQTTAAVRSPRGHDAATAMIHAPGEPIPPARLVMLTPPAPGAEFALSRDVLRIGRAEDLDAWVNHRSISREHAEIRRSRGSNGQARGAETYTILDLKSANGVRVNGREIHQHQLVPGDVLELGQVRFRFVGEGETYVFEADRTVQMEAIDVAVGQSRAPIYAALAIIGLAVVVALVFAIGPSIRIEDDAPIATALGPEDGHNVRRDSQLEADREHREHIEACEAALAEGRVEAALESVARALTHRPDSAAAIACRSRAEAAEADAQVFENGAAALRAGDFGAAHQAFSMLSTDGIFGDREEVASAREGLVTHHLQAGRAAVRTDPSEARAHAEAVLDLEDVSEAQRAEAREIIAGARRALSAAERPPRERDPNLTPMRPPPTEDDPETPPRPTGTGDGIQACFQQHGSGRPYNQCILQNVRPSNARNLEALILAQRGLENQAAAYRLMRTYVDRFPANPSARAYQQILNVQGQ